MPSPFNNEQQNESLTKRGYVVVDSLLSKGDIVSLADFAGIHADQYNSAFHTTHFSSDTDYKKKVYELICEVVFPKVAGVIKGYRPIFGNFMIKLPDPAVKMPLHADWCYVDEERSRSLSVWVPLIDTDEQNGCIGVIDESHTITNIIRGPNIKQSSTLEQDAIWAAKYGKLIPMKAGDALIYDHRLMHFSPANSSRKIRPAINLSIVPEGVEVIHYCIPNGAEKIEKYIVPSSEFFINYQNFQRPMTGTLMEQLPKDTVQFIDPRMKFYKLKRVLKKVLG